MSKVFVVMGNDYPDCVFSDGVLAEDYCKKKMDQQKKEAIGTIYEGMTPRVYYRSYEFIVNKNFGDSK